MLTNGQKEHSEVSAYTEDTITYAPKQRYPIAYLDLSSRRSNFQNYLWATPSLPANSTSLKWA